MTHRSTKEQAVEVLRILTVEHAAEDYFTKAEVVPHDIGFGVDLWVDGKKWRAARHRVSPISPSINRVPVCILMVG